MDSIFSIQSEEEFNTAAISVFQYQFKHVRVYREFCNLLNRTDPKDYKEIPFLPISFFKTHTVLSDEYRKKTNLVFKSSGTTLNKRSEHHIPSTELYERSFLPTFSQQIVPPENAIIFALLPNYIEQGESSLVYMVDFLIRATQHSLSGFYLSNPKALIEAIQKAKTQDKTIVLFGVSYALLDFAEKNIDLSGVKIIETGGMKGRRKEMIRSELHEELKKGLNVSKIFSEYGMTELLSQGYTDGSEFFRPPNWMKIMIRDVNDPFHFLANEKTGGVNVIDLANLYSCSFISTDDLGVEAGKRFKILGRFDQSDLRGCNLLVN
ncbi:acyl transferase [Brumimicrobium salinarum]|uniref:Acyl transferase n=1 Tax=Brumimicrobium salinarum TaxID=2058658 RepID=A0A2I0R6X7_9FLAO|nr:acyl transferase [Brumimicrobium salinarum]